MNHSSSLSMATLLGGLGLLAAVLLLRPGYLANPEVLGMVVIGQIVIASICKYKQSFFLVLMATFFWAGIQLPLQGAWLEGRWIVLGLGSLAGLVIYMRSREHHFSVIHLIALSCVLSAVVSASVSAYPQEALLKSLSLFFLFLYGTTGARLAYSPFDRVSILNRLVVMAEVVVYLSAMAYFILRIPVFGNPNSLGAVMGIIVIPLLIWGFLCADSVLKKRRLGIELCLAVALLMSSFSRAGIVAALFSYLLICVAMRRYRLVVSGLLAFAAISILVALFIPPPLEDIADTKSESVASLFLYKGKREQGILGSRKGPWDATIAVIRNHPWFGSGFGTSTTDRSASYFEITRARFVDSRMVREHGNSYLAILEWSGLLGVFPFYLLVIATIWQVKKAFMELRRTGNVFAPAVPAAAIIVAGLIGAMFEDWLFAVGYYMSVFFWSMAFILADLVSSPPVYVFEQQPDPFANPQFLSPVAR